MVCFLFFGGLASCGCLTTTIPSAYERYLRKPQDESYSYQYLQELGGEATASLSSAIYMADSSSSNKEQENKTHQLDGVVSAHVQYA
jgi:predicted house-cleaning NTP pyrophosphatase (Maf/HAM1 superfamily)